MCIWSYGSSVVKLLLAWLVPTVDSVFDLLDHLLVSTALLVGLRLGSLPRNRPKMIRIKSSIVLFLLASLCLKNVTGEFSFRSCVNSRLRRWLFRKNLKGLLDWRPLWRTCLNSGNFFVGRDNDTAVNALLRSGWLLNVGNQRSLRHLSGLEWVIHQVDGILVHSWAVDALGTRFRSHGHSVRFVFCLQMLQTLRCIHRFNWRVRSLKLLLLYTIWHNSN